MIPGNAKLSRRGAAASCDDHKVANGHKSDAMTDAAMKARAGQISSHGDVSCHVDQQLDLGVHRGGIEVDSGVGQSGDDKAWG